MLLLAALVALFPITCLSTALHSDWATLQPRGDNHYVFAHLVVGTTSDRTSATDWDADMQRAKSYGIDAFALNIGIDPFTDTQLAYAYASAANNGMKCFISFDFNFWSVSSATAVGQKVAQFANSPAQLLVDGKIFVSSFVGDGVDVTALRNAASIPVYFAPNFHPNYGTSLSSVDGALNWMGWPNNGKNRAPASGQTGTVEAGDSEYISALNGKDYIAPVSPWFFTHYGAEVAYSKNWLFPSDLLWFQRWTELLKMGPRFVEIISWNDFGESHYVGPLSSLHTDDGASKWVNDMPHDGWLDMAKPFIAAFKAGATAVNDYIVSDQLIYWYRPQLMGVDCDATDTCMQPVSNSDYYIGPPNGWETVTDNVFVVTLLKSGGNLQVNSGGTNYSFNAPAGATSYSVPMGVGRQSFSLGRNSQTILTAISLKDIINGCVCGLYNFNAYVGTVPNGPIDVLAADGLKSFAVGLRVSTCSATPSLGGPSPTTTMSSVSKTLITTTGSVLSNTSSIKALASSSPISSSSISGLTTFSTSLKTTSPTSMQTYTKTSTSLISSTFQPTSASASAITKSTITTTNSRADTAKTTTSTPNSTATSALTQSTSCIAGQGSGNYAGLCSFCCTYGYCPPGPCTCTAYGTPNSPPPTNGRNGVSAPGLGASYSGLCSFACNHGYCPSGACQYA